MWTFFFLLPKIKTNLKQHHFDILLITSKEDTHRTTQDLKVVPVEAFQYYFKE